MSVYDMFNKLPNNCVQQISHIPKHAKRDYFNFFEGSKYLNALRNIGKPNFYHNLDDESDRHSYK